MPTEPGLGGGHLEQLMRRALELGSSHSPHPNPRVGAIVLSSEGRTLGEGAHRGPGGAHAEQEALAHAGERARGGTLVVTLEPCVHQGRTPPCVEAVVRSGVARVVVGAIDPDQRVAGEGLRRLGEAGLEVVSGVLLDEVERADPAYFHHRRSGRPLVTLKVASTLDGQVAAADGTARWISSPESREDGHLLRAASDAVVVGAGTLRADDPLLDVRLEGYEGRQPRPVVVAGRSPLPEEARLWKRDPVVVAAASGPVPAGTVVEAAGAGGLVDLAVALERLGDLGLLALLVEGGPALAASLLQEGLVDRGVWYLAGRLAGGTGRPAFASVFRTVADARAVRIEEVRRVGPDLRIDWRP